MSYKITNRATGSVFTAEPDESILDAARRQGINLSFSCLNGTCASCKSQVIEGRWHYPNLPPQALTKEESANGMALLCQAAAESDLTVVAREVEALRNITAKIFPTRVASMTFPAPDVALVRLKLPNNIDFEYLAGQHLEIILADGKRRAFSIANAPDGTGELELHVRHVPGGGFTDFVFNGMKVGSLVRIEAPLGTFFLRDQTDRPIICVAGGTGMSPIKAIVEELIEHHPNREATVYWGARSKRDLYLLDTVADWQRDHPQIQVVPVLSEPIEADDWDGRTGLVHEAVIADHQDMSAFDVYMSGPPPLIEAGRKAFAEKGLPERHLYYDSFEFAPDILAKMVGVQDEHFAR